jgi:hypothetical protein
MTTEVETAEGIVDLDSYQKDKDEFNEATNILLSADDDTSDEDIIKELDAKKEDSTDKAGEATKDQGEETDGILTEEDATKFTDPTGVAQTDNSTDGDNSESDPEDTDWKAKYEAVEAELKKEKQKTSSWDGRIRAANKKAEALKEENATLREQIETKTVADPDKETDKETLERFKDDFPELADVVNVLMKRVDGVTTAQDKGSSSVDDGDSEGSSGESTAAHEEETTSTHLETINKVHPDLSEMVNSGVLLTWINKQKPFIKPTLENIYYDGSAQAVIDLCSQFKDSTGWTSQLANSDAAKEAAKAKKLADLKEVDSESGGAPVGGPDKNDFAGAAKEAFAEEK